DLRSLRVRRGASTLTMQLHRLRDPRPRSAWAKVEQAVRAVQIERVMSKEQIVVEYLNRAPFGGNYVGAGAASWHYFNRPCADLTVAQAALLAGLPQRPDFLFPDVHLDRAKVRRDIVLARMRERGMITPAEHDQAVSEPVDVARTPLPQNDGDDRDEAHGALPTLVALSTRAG